MSFSRSIGAALTVALFACSNSNDQSVEAQTPAGIGAATRGADSVAGVAPVAATSNETLLPAGDGRVPNELGRIPVLEYHVIGGTDALFTRSAETFRRELELLYERGYRPISVSDLVDRRIDLPAGLSPVVFTFDDASPGQFRYLEQGGRRVLDDTSALGMWKSLQRRHPDWGSRATFCLLSAAREGHAFFGEKGIQGQQSEWRFEKLRSLVDEGFELCGHTLWHARLDRYPDAAVQEQIARGVLAIDSAVPGYKVRSFALPLVMWPRRRELASRGSWRDPRSGRDAKYSFDAVLMVAGGPSRSPHDPQFDPARIPRTIVSGNALVSLLDRLDRTGERYVSDGDPSTVARPQPTVASSSSAPEPRSVQKRKGPVPVSGRRSAGDAPSPKTGGSGGR